MRKCVNVNVELKMYINSKQNEKIDKIAVLRKDNLCSDLPARKESFLQGSKEYHIVMVILLVAKASAREL